MNYDQQINLITEHIKADKTIVQPWRNKAVARLEEAQAFVRMGQTTTYPSAPNRVDANTCTCSNGVVDNNCWIHGAKNARN